MHDLINRQAAIDAIHNADTLIYEGEAAVGRRNYMTKDECCEIIDSLPSAQPDVNEYRKRGEWDMFELITSAWYGKQYYFKEDNGMAYSRKSHKTMTVDDAILEFIREIGDVGDE